MRNLLANAQAGIEAFVAQRDDLVMVVACSDNDAALLLKILRDVEQTDGSDVFLMFGDDFVAPEPYAAVLIERLREQHRMACTALAEAGRAPLPPLPDTLSDATRPPARRLGEAMMFARSLLPEEGGHRLVWAMVPQHIADATAYAELAGAFAPRQGVRPGMRGLRIILRGMADAPAGMPQLAGAPRVRTLALDFGPDAIAAALAQEVEDETLPTDQRMQALLSVALLDSAHGRTGDALAALRVLLGHSQSTGDQAMQAIVLNAVGDIHHRGGTLDQAQHWYECAVTPASASGSPMILFTVVRNLADVTYQRAQYAMAEELYDGADRLAAHLLDPEAKARALEGRGLSQEQQQHYEQAVESWEGAATLSRAIGLPSCLRANLQHLARGYARLGRRAEAAAADTELRQIEHLEDVR